MALIERANNLGVLDSKDIDKNTSNYLKKLLKENTK